MKKITVPENWLFVSFVLDSFVYNNNCLTSDLIYDYVVKQYRNYLQKLPDLDFASVMSYLVDKGFLYYEFDDMTHLCYYMRRDLLNCPHFNIG